jgi:hypothetical protein
MVSLVLVHDLSKKNSLCGYFFFAFCVETAVGKATTQRYETRKSGADSSQGSNLSLLAAKRKMIESFFSKPYLQAS